MKASLLSSLLLPAAVSARFIEANEVNRILPYIDALLDDVPAPSPERFLIELSPGETRYVTEEEKWELRRVCVARLPFYDPCLRPNRRCCIELADSYNIGWTTFHGYYRKW